MYTSIRRCLPRNAVEIGVVLCLHGTRSLLCCDLIYNSYLNTQHESPRISVRVRECTRSRRAPYGLKIYSRRCACGRGVERSRRIYHRASNRNQSQLYCAVPAALPVAVVSSAAGPHPDDDTRPMSLTFLVTFHFILSFEIKKSCGVDYFA